LSCLERDTVSAKQHLLNENKIAEKQSGLVGILAMLLSSSQTLKTTKIVYDP